MRPSPALVPLVLALALAACGSAPQVPPDFNACADEAARAPRVQGDKQRLAFIDACMTRKGWRAAPDCVETQFQGTPFCRYIDTK
jgi:hypothetical protein